MKVIDCFCILFLLLASTTVDASRRNLKRGVPKQVRDALHHMQDDYSSVKSSKRPKKGKEKKWKRDKKKKGKKKKKESYYSAFVDDDVASDATPGSTAGPSGDDCPAQHVCDFRISYKTASGNFGPLSDDDTKQLRENLIEYLESAIGQVLPNLRSIEVSDWEFDFDPSWPDSTYDFTLYIPSLFFDLETDGSSSIPSNEVLYSLVEDSITADYILSAVRTIPGFSDVVEVYSRGFSPDNSNSGQDDDQVDDDGMVACPPQHVCDFYIAFVMGSDPPNPITDEAVAELRRNTENYFTQALADSVVVVGYDYSDAWHKPQHRFTFALIVSSMFIDGADTSASDDLYSKLQGIITIEYLLNYVRSVPAFSTVNEALLQPLEK